MDGLIIERTFHVVIVGNGFEPEKLAKSGKRLDFGEPGCENVRLELQQLQFDFEEIPFAHIAGLEAGVTDINGLLKTVVVLLGKIKGGLREQNVDELRGEIEGELTLVVRHLSARYGGRVFRGLQTMLALPATFEEIADADVELRLVRQIVRIELARIEERKKLRIPGQDGIGAKIGGNFLRLILKYGRLRGEKGVIVLQGKANCFIEVDALGRGL